ncbi:type I restriction enzyme, S subunit [Megasphaera elsdenii]|uniref:restriction endonuclease subunit S n=1 Tax=Megasphaera elsdenii TaxID=907 RepID=UPI0008EC52FF|nr:restriction endonuclease subunit S [Megasphaera elsdenii]SFI09977.1 type I restriction enzyme, S subunit [Megasphaera elsdenii]
MTKHLHIDTQAMRAKILDLAIQGKLTDQRAEDGNAQDLLKDIQAEKEKLIKEQQIKKEKPLPEIEADEIPFEIPKNWMWARWGTLSISIKYGYNTSAQKDGKIKMVRISDIQNNQVNWDSVPFCNIPKEEITQYLLRKNDILFARTGGTVGKSYLVSEVPENVVYAGYLIRTRYSEKLSPQYLKYFMESDLYWSQLKKGTTTTAQPNCNAKTLGKMVLPLPPLAEQKRIADKVATLFAQLDAIDKAYEEYRELQQTMKAKLLDLAVQGKLTDQREEDGNARDLLKEIQAEKEKLIKEKQIKKEKPLPEITEEEKTFDIPENWMWVRLGEMILNHIGGGTPDKSNEAYWNGDIPWMSVKDVHQDSMYADRTIDSITPAGLENSSSNLIEANRLIVVMRMAVGRAVINKLPVAINQDLRALFFRDNVTQEYILRIFKILKFETSGMTVKGIKLWVLLNTPIPLPPLAEQKRIVAKLDELLPLCNVPGVYSKEK